MKKKPATKKAPTGCRPPDVNQAERSMLDQIIKWTEEGHSQVIHPSSTSLHPCFSLPPSLGGDAWYTGGR
jgi:hypothetical protein